MGGCGCGGSCGGGGGCAGGSCAPRTVVRTEGSAASLPFNMFGQGLAVVDDEGLAYKSLGARQLGAPPGMRARPVMVQWPSMLFRPQPFRRPGPPPVTQFVAGTTTAGIRAKAASLVNAYCAAGAKNIADIRDAAEALCARAPFPQNSVERANLCAGYRMKAKILTERIVAACDLLRAQFQAWVRAGMPTAGQGVLVLQDYQPVTLTEVLTVPGGFRKPGPVFRTLGADPPSTVPPAAAAQGFTQAQWSALTDPQKQAFMEAVAKNDADTKQKIFDAAKMGLTGVLDIIANAMKAGQSDSERNYQLQRAAAELAQQKELARIQAQRDIELAKLGFGPAGSSKGDAIDTVTGQNGVPGISNNNQGQQQSSSSGGGIFLAAAAAIGYFLLK